jgi:hypothetical protein
MLLGSGYSIYAKASSGRTQWRQQAVKSNHKNAWLTTELVCIRTKAVKFSCNLARFGCKRHAWPFCCITKSAVMLLVSHTGQLAGSQWKVFLTIYILHASQHFHLRSMSDVNSSLYNTADVH